MRSVLEQGFQSLMVESNCMPGSPHWCVASAMPRSTSRARNSSTGSLVVTARVQ